MGSSDLFTATLIADGALSDAHVNEGAHRIVLAGGVLDRAEWLDEGSAAVIHFDWPDLARHERPLLAAAVADALGPVDVAVQPAAGREKRLLVADMDSTMITVECIDELADYAGIKAEVAAVTERAMRGELDFAAALDARVALLAGLEEGAIDRCLAERVRDTPGAAVLVRTMRARGARCVLVSGGFTRFAEPVGERLGFDRVVANRLGAEHGRLTGRVQKPIVDSGTKERVLAEEVAALGIAAAETLAVGDGANDLPMIRAAGLGVAYRAKPVVAAEAGARVEAGDLTALLWMQGIARAAWVTGVTGV